MLWTAVGKASTLRGRMPMERGELETGRKGGQRRNEQRSTSGRAFPRQRQAASMPDACLRNRIAAAGDISAGKNQETGEDRRRRRDSDSVELWAHRNLAIGHFESTVFTAFPSHAVVDHQKRLMITDTLLMTVHHMVALR